MKRILSIISAVLCLASCAKESLIPTDPTLPDGNFMTLTVNAQDLIQTKAERNGIDELNENAINSIYYFIYPKDGDQSTPTGKAVMCNYIEAKNSEGQAVKNDYTFHINLNDTDINDKVFKRPNTSCFVYVIANLPSGTLPLADDADTSFETISETLLNADFTKNVKQGSFVMEGWGIVNIQSRTEKLVANGTIWIDRLATKTTIDMTVNESVQGTDEDSENVETWKPDYTKMYIQFRNGASNARLDGNYLSSSQIARFEATASNHFSTSSVIDDKTYYSTEIPFYTYPMEWTPGDKLEPYLYIIIPWSKDNGKSYKNSYYKLLLAGKEYAQNTWHSIRLTIGALGSWTPDTPKTIVAQQYKVADWKHAVKNTSGSGTEDGKSVDAIIKDAKYLVVPSNYFTIENLNQLQFRVTTSHDCEIADLKITQDVFSGLNITSRTVYSKTGTVGTNDYVAISGSTVTVKKELVNTQTSGSDYDISPYTYTFTIRHKETPAIKEYITVVQYPAIYITPYGNKGGVDPSKSTNVDNGLGYVYINGNHTKDGSAWQQPSGGTGSNANGNMYEIKTTALDANTKCSDGSAYIIGDPREVGASTLATATGFPARDHNNQTIYSNNKSYHKTNTNTQYEHFISPSFRIASSYGKSQTMSRDNAERRCASYQEDGYPAGRWRMPTYAEFNYIAKLSSDGKIPHLFTDYSTQSSCYWTAQGPCRYYNNGTITKSYNTTSAAVRCVYDDWYWGSERDSRTKNGNVYTYFIWGNE